MFKVAIFGKKEAVHSETVKHGWATQVLSSNLLSFLLFHFEHGNATIGAAIEAYMMRQMQFVAARTAHERGRS